MNLLLEQTIKELERVKAEQPYWIFRGETGSKHQKITSQVYRDLNDYTFIPETVGHSAQLREFNRNHIDIIRSEWDDNRSDDAILCEVEMNGGRTDFINFTRCLYTALFFAIFDVIGNKADTSVNPGRVVFFDTKQKLEPGP